MYNLLARVGQISTVVEGREYSWHSTEFAFVGPLVSERSSRWLLSTVRSSVRRRVFGPLVAAASALGTRDFVDSDPDRTAANIMAYRHRHAFLVGLYESVARCDVLVINAEGDLVFTTPPRREALFLLGMVALGVRLGKSVFFANALVSDCPFTGRNAATFAAARSVLARCRKVLVRDGESLALVQTEMPDVDCELVPDSLFSWFPIFEDKCAKPPANGDFLIPFPERQRYLGKLDFSQPYICIGGSAGANDRERAIRHFVSLVEAVQQLELPVYLTENDGRDSFLEEVAEATGVGIIPVYTPIFMAGAVLANASLFISGRYHPSIMAALGGTPSIFLSSVAHKMRSVQALLEYPEPREFPVFPTASEIEEIRIISAEYLRADLALRNRIRGAASRRAQEVLRLCDHLAAAKPTSGGTTVEQDH